MGSARLESGQLAVASRQFSARTPSGFRVLFTRYSSPATRHSARCAGGGFTLIELLVVVAIVAILAGLTLGTMGYVNKKGAESRARAEVAALSSAIDNYKMEFGTYPASVEVLFAELTGQGSVNKSKVLFEPTPQILDTNTRRFVDPWGNNYQYTTNPTVNIGFFDLWSTGSGEGEASIIRN